MSIASLIKRMRELGAPMEAIELAVAAVEEVEAKFVAAEEARKAGQRERTRRYRLLCDPVTDDLRAAVIARDGMRCAYCGDDVEVAHIDHVTPVSRGGHTDTGNLVVACKPCNSSKRDRTLSEWSGQCR